MACVACFQGLVRETLTAFVYALFLAVVVLQDNILSSLELGQAGLLLQAVVTWGLFIKRDNWIGFLSLDQRPAEGALGLGSDGRAGGGFGFWGLHGPRVAALAGRFVTAPARVGLTAIRRHTLAADTAASEASKAAVARGVLADQTAREAAVKAQKPSIGQRTLETSEERLSEIKAGLADRRRVVARRQQSLEQRRDAQLRERARLHKEQQQLDGRLSAIDAAALEPGVTEGDQHDIAATYRDVRAKREAAASGLQRVDASLGHTDSQLRAMDAQLFSLTGQIGIADRGLARWRGHKAKVDQELSDVRAARETPRFRVARAYARRADRADAQRSLFDGEERERARRRFELRRRRVR